MSVETKNNLNFVFCPPLPGKPDPNWDPSSELPRGRVVQKAQKNDTCWYYTLQLLRNDHRIGKHPTESQIEMRKSEELFSQHRKSTTEANSKHEWGIRTARDFSITRRPPVIYKKNAQETMKLVPVLISDSEKRRMTFQAFLDFIKNSDETTDFLAYAENNMNQAKLAAHLTAIKELGIGEESMDEHVPEQRTSKWKEMNLSIPKWNDMSLSQKAWLAEIVVFRAAFFTYGCKLSRWTPLAPIESLINELNTHGPHFVKGMLGKDFYASAPIEQAQKIEERTVLAWHRNCPLTNRSGSKLHAVLIVGAESQGKNKNVYFIDPEDGSDPQHVATQKIYSISYEMLQRSIASLSGFSLKHPRTSEPIFFESDKNGLADYALHM